MWSKDVWPFARAAKKLQCYCRLMHAVTWSSQDPEPTQSCDGLLAEGS